MALSDLSSPFSINMSNRLFSRKFPTPMYTEMDIVKPEAPVNSLEPKLHLHFGMFSEDTTFGTRLDMNS
ncbi:hypothetical protein EUGRSUZ_D00817 [Eucalyptus grandis]|uniref:Uncharacterized protein n=2 Tax=Eucalyptus grandis TaxID=71139 RepID=A0ACC3L4E8_EUCGR|nr:hypothetical protein EUGRSUZ_D00817 [Eucalyptus grandis]